MFTKVVAIISLSLGVLMFVLAAAITADPIAYRTGLLPDAQPKVEPVGIVSDGGELVIHKEGRARERVEIDNAQAAAFAQALKAPKENLNPVPAVTTQSGIPLTWMTARQYKASVDKFGNIKESK